MSPRVTLLPDVTTNRHVSVVNLLACPHPVRRVQDHVSVSLPVELNVDEMFGRQLQIPSKSRVDIQVIAILDQWTQFAWPSTSYPAH